MMSLEKQFRKVLLAQRRVELISQQLGSQLNCLLNLMKHNNCSCNPTCHILESAEKSISRSAFLLAYVYFLVTTPSENCKIKFTNLQMIQN